MTCNTRRPFLIGTGRVIRGGNRVFFGPRQPWREENSHNRTRARARRNGFRFLFHAASRLGFSCSTYRRREFEIQYALAPRTAIQQRFWTHGTPAVVISPVFLSVTKNNTDENINSIWNSNNNISLCEKLKNNVCYVVEILGRSPRLNKPTITIR